MRRTITCLFTLLVVCLQSTEMHAQEFDYQLIRYPESRDTKVHGINSRGMVVGQYGMLDASATTNPGGRGFVYDGETFQDIYVPGSNSTSANGINDIGIVVGDFVDATGRQFGFKFDGTSYETIVAPFADELVAEAINDHGVIVGDVSDDRFDRNIRGFQLSGDAYEEIEYSGANQTFVTGINDAGDVSGTYVTAVGSKGFATSQQTTIDAGGLTSDARGINDRNLAVGNVFELVSTAGVEWEIARLSYVYDYVTHDFFDFPFPNGICTFKISALNPVFPQECQQALRDINDHGQIAGYIEGDGGFLVGLIATPRNYQLGDFNRSGTLDSDDLDLLALALTDGSYDDSFDVNLDGTLNEADRVEWVEGLRGTWFGDSNMDGEFDSSDLVTVFERGEYEDGAARNSTWSSGDWNGDLEFDSADLVAAFQGGGYDAGPRTAVAVPEPALVSLTASIGLLLLMGNRRGKMRVVKEFI